MGRRPTLLITAGVLATAFVAAAAGQSGVRSYDPPLDIGVVLYDDAPPLDLIMAPGGIGTLREVENHRLLDFIAERAAEVQLTTSGCAGSAILVKVGVLDDLPATANKAFFSYIAGFGPETK